MCRSWSSLLALILLCSLLAWAALRWEDFPRQLSTPIFSELQPGFYGGPALRAQIRTLPPVNSTRSSLSGRRLNVCSNLPTFQRPFFFFHIQKTSGSTFREYINEGASNCNIPSAVGCHNLPCWWGRSPEAKDIKCPFSMRKDFTPILCSHPDSVCSSIFAGHFQPGLVGLLAAADQSRSCLPEAGPRWESEPSFDCVVFLREPLARTISSYHDKHPVEAFSKPFGDMSTEEQIGLIYKYRTNLQMVKWLSPKTDLQEAKEMLQKCVVGITERMEESYMVITSSFPWIMLPSGDIVQKHKGSHVAPESLSEDSQKVLRSHLEPDVSLYEYALEQFEKQWQALDGN